MASAFKNLRFYTVLSACISIMPLQVLAAGEQQLAQASPTLELHLDALDKSRPAAVPQSAPAPSQPGSPSPKLIWNVGPPGQIIEAPPKKENPFIKNI